MELSSRSKTILRESAGYLLAALLTLLLVFAALEFWRVDWRVPFDYSGDALVHAMWVRGLLDNGWHLHHDALGAPFGLDMHDFPLGASMHFFAMKCFGLFTSDPMLVLNWYFLLTFPLTTILTLAVFRHFGFSYLPSLAGSVLFAFLPFHVTRGVAGLFAVCYFLVPAIIMVAIWLYQGRPMFFERGDDGRLRFCWNRRTLMALLIAAALSLGDVYQTFFACFFLAVAGLARSLTVRARLPLANAGLLVGVLVAGVVANTTPSLLYAFKHGKNPDAARRSMQEAEFFGMRVAQLLMPVSGHRVPVLADAKVKFNTKLMLVTENDMTALGVVGSVGFLFLVGALLAPLVRPARLPGAGSDADLTTEAGVLEPLRLFNVLAVLLATIGGFGLLVAAALPQIRSYNRMSMFIGFFSLFGMVLLFQAWQRRWSGAAAGRLGYLVAIAVIVVVGVADQTPGPKVERVAMRERDFADDVAFVSAIESALPEGAMVYQMPYRVFPEGGSYDHLRLSVHSRRLQWSYPTMRSRPPDFWHKELAAQTIEDMAAQLVFAGFQGICIDRLGYADHGKDVETKLTEILGAPAFVGTQQRFSYFALQDYAYRLRREYSSEAWQARVDEAQHPVIVAWKNGFQQCAEMHPKDGRWCTARGVMELHNFGSQPRHVSLTLVLRTGHPDHANLKIEGHLLRRELKINDQNGQVEEALVVPPGRHSLKFSCDAVRFNDNPRRIFCVVDFKVRPVDAAHAHLK